MTGRVLVVEGDHAKLEQIAGALAQEGLEVVLAPDPGIARQLFDESGVDAVIIDLTPSSSEGIKLGHELRALTTIPIIVLGSDSSVEELEEALTAGADDYVRSPLDLAELRVRVRSLLRRSELLAPRDPIVRLADLVINAEAYTVHKGGHEVHLSRTEFILLYELVRQKGVVVAREKLIETVWGYNYLGSSRLVDMAIHRLRHKVEDDPAHPTLIATVRGIGYRVDDPESS
jgi:two-component system response regulator MtrA